MQKNASCSHETYIKNARYRVLGLDDIGSFAHTSERILTQLLYVLALALITLAHSTHTHDTNPHTLTRTHERAHLAHTHTHTHTLSRAHIHSPLTHVHVFFISFFSRRVCCKKRPQTAACLCTSPPNKSLRNSARLTSCTRALCRHRYLN